MGCCQSDDSRLNNNHPVPRLAGWTHIAFSGGAANGIMHVGAYRALWDAEVIQNLSGAAGTSIGSLFATLAAIRVHPDTVVDEIMALKTSKLADGSVCCLARGSLGAYRGAYLLKWTEALLNRVTGKSQVTFAALHGVTGRHLKICVFNETKCRTEYWDHETHPDIAVSFAIRASSSMPIYYDPVVTDSGIMVDGGLGDVYPVDAFDNKTTMGVLLLASVENKSEAFVTFQAITGLVSHMLALYESMATVQFRAQHGSDDWRVRTIALRGPDNPQWNVALTKKEKRLWIQRSYTTTTKNVEWCIDHGAFIP